MESRKIAFIYGLAGLGFAAGIYYAYKTDKKFLGYIGFALLGNIAGVAGGRIITSIAFK